MLVNLKCEMVRKNLSTVDISREIGKTSRAVSYKIAGNQAFTLPEAIAIRDRFFPSLTLEYLFAEDDPRPMV